MNTEQAAMVADGLACLYRLQRARHDLHFRIVRESDLVEWSRKLGGMKEGVAASTTAPSTELVQALDELLEHVAGIDRSAPLEPKLYDLADSALLAYAKVAGERGRLAGRDAGEAIKEGSSVVAVAYALSDRCFRAKRDTLRDVAIEKLSAYLVGVTDDRKRGAARSLHEALMAWASPELSDEVMQAAGAMLVAEGYGIQPIR